MNHGCTWQNERFSNGQQPDFPTSPLWTFGARWTLAVGCMLTSQGPLRCWAAPLAPTCHMPAEAPPWPLCLCPSVPTKVSGLCQMSPVEQALPPPSHWGKEARLKRFVQRYESLGKTPGAHKGSVVFRGWCWGATDHKQHGRISRKCPRSWLCGWSHDYIKVCQSSQSCTQTQQIITK